MRELSLHILDALENSVEAGATRIELLIEEDTKNDILKITIQDNGRGMDEEFAQRVLDPFVTTRTTRHVGLGLPLFAAAAQQCNGNLQVQSKPGVGTKVTATFQHSHIDRAPLGDIVTSIMAVVLSEQAVDIRYKHVVDGRTFELDTAEVRRELGTVPLSHPLIRQWLESTLAEGLASLHRPRP
ncbi:MAG: ATP-binding protein [Chloroflexi bacterium]|nr:ATP-binding protein [Chloroflexota bacterium]